jgi:hypothetical protein
MLDFYQEVDVSAQTTYREVDFGFESVTQAVVNESGVPIDVSFDGSTLAMILEATGPTSVISWEAPHNRSAIWVKRHTGTGSGLPVIKITASNPAEV